MLDLQDDLCLREYVADVKRTLVELQGLIAAGGLGALMGGVGPDPFIGQPSMHYAVVGLFWEVQLMKHDGCLQVPPYVNFPTIHESCLAIDDNFVFDETTCSVDYSPMCDNDNLDAVEILPNLENVIEFKKLVDEVFVKGVDKDDVVLMAARASRLENQDAIDAAIVIMLADPKQARAGITEIHFLPFNPTDKRTALAYIDKAGTMHRVSKCAPEQEVFERNKDSSGGPWEFIALLPLFHPPRHDSAETIRRALELGVSDILHYGKSMENTMRAYSKGIKIGKILIHRDGDNGKQLIYEKLPKDISERHVLLLYLVLGTGNSANQAIELLIQKGVPESHIIFLNLISAPEGIHCVSKRFPTLKIVTLEIDVALNEEFRVIPGMGEFGDRYFGTDD
ncbi:hypothetical protein AgCh_022954 [Apium graveolens]